MSNKIAGIEVYPVGLLADIKHKKYRQIVKHIWNLIQSRKWSALRNHFNGYLAEWSFPPKGVVLTKAGSGWTKGSALRSLGINIAESNLAEGEV